jgi:hypothetical protein
MMLVTPSEGNDHSFAVALVGVMTLTGKRCLDRNDVKEVNHE